eukprot:284816124_3
MESGSMTFVVRNLQKIHNCCTEISSDWHECNWSNIQSRWLLAWMCLYSCQTRCAENKKLKSELVSLKEA